MPYTLLLVHWKVLKEDHYPGGWMPHVVASSPSFWTLVDPAKGLFYDRVIYAGPVDEAGRSTVLRLELTEVH